MDLPNEIIDCILQIADLPIDTRLALKVPPSRLVIEPSLQAIRDTLSALCERRVKFWKTYLEHEKHTNGVLSSALECVSGPSWQIGPLRSMCIQMEIWDIDWEVRMSMEVQELVESDPADPLGPYRELFVRRAQFCIVHTGVRCKRFIYVIDESEDEDL